MRADAAEQKLQTLQSRLLLERSEAELALSRQRSNELAALNARLLAVDQAREALVQELRRQPERGNDQQQRWQCDKHDVAPGKEFQLFRHGHLVWPDRRALSRKPGCTRPRVGDARPGSQGT